MTAKDYRYLESQSQNLLRTDSSERYIDFGVELVVVEKCEKFGVVPDGTALPKLVEVRDRIKLGGSYDTLTRKFVGPCKRWRVWLIGEKQLKILLESPTQHNLLYSAEGAGKSVLTAMWMIVQVIKAAEAGINGAIGGVAPTSARLSTLIRAVKDLMPVQSAKEPASGSWATQYITEGEIVTMSGHTMQFRSSKRQSGATGSPIQGWTWNLGAAVDEIQDVVEQGAYPDIVARLRGGKHSPIMACGTAKDSAGWRTWRDALSKLWTIHRLSYLDTPFIHDEHWVMMKGELSEREWKRRGLALDVGPESQLYHGFLRERNVHIIPSLLAKDVTKKVLERWGRNLEALVGHDPGAIQDYSVILKAFKMPKEKYHRWYVVGEVRTKDSTTEEHAIALIDHLQTEFGIQYSDLDDPKALLRIDPYGENDQKTDKSVYLTFKQCGIHPHSAAYKKGKGNGRIPKEPRIEMVNRLCHNAAQISRLFVALGDDGKPVAPLLIESLELSTRDAAGQAETVKKKLKGPGGDLSDPTASLGYALWILERIRVNTERLAA